MFDEPLELLLFYLLRVLDLFYSFLDVV